MGWVRRLGSTMFGSRVDRTFDDEARFHIEELTDEYVRRGVDPERARRDAERRFGNVAVARERTRDADTLRWLADAAQDVRYTCRLLRRNPAFATVAVVTLAVAIGANTAVFSLADASLFHALPFPDADRLVTVNEVVPLIGDRPIRLTAPDLRDYEDQSLSFDALGGWVPRAFELSGGHESERVAGVRATEGMFAALRVAPALGRTFTRDEDRGGAPVCLISDGLWRRWFGADPRVLGADLRLDRQPYRVIGVMPRGFEFPIRGAMFDSARPVDVWVPMSLSPRELAARADSWDYNGIARLKAGTTVAQASADVNGIAQHIAADLMPGDRTGRFSFSAVVRPLAPQVSGGVRPLVVVLSGAVALVLLIACVNVANLLVARGAYRQREMAVRSALGAGRGRIVRQLIVETLVIAAAAAVIGGMLGWWSTAALAGFVPSRFAILARGAVNLRVLLFGTAAAVLSAVAIGIVPGLAAGRGDQTEALGERGAIGGGVRHRRLRSALVVAEIALALVLLVGAGLLIRSFRDLLNTAAGFRPEGAVAGSVALPEADYPDAARERRFFEVLLDRLRGDPDALLVGAGSSLPLNGRRNERVFTPEDYTPPPNAGLNIASMTSTSGDYLQAIGATLLKGRYFTPHDNATGEGVAIVTEALARRYWRGRDPIGKRLKWGIAESPDPWLTVVGVVADVKDALDAPASLQVFVPNEQVEMSIPEYLRRDYVRQQLRSMFVVVRGRAAAETLAATLRGAVRSLDSRLAVASLQPLARTLSDSAAPQRFNMLLMAGFAAIALLLAAIGIYGMVAYAVAQRTHEIGIRLAVGASASDVVSMIVREGATLALAGLALGTAAAAALAPTLRALLFGVRPLDPATFAAVAALLMAVALLATYLPARRATRLDPLAALRAG